jgi:hypothetical protein
LVTEYEVPVNGIVETQSWSARIEVTNALVWLLKYPVIEKDPSIRISKSVGVAL